MNEIVRFYVSAITIREYESYILSYLRTTDTIVHHHEKLKILILIIRGSDPRGGGGRRGRVPLNPFSSSRKKLKKCKKQMYSKY